MDSFLSSFSLLAYISSSFVSLNLSLELIYILLCLVSICLAVILFVISPFVGFLICQLFRSYGLFVLILKSKSLSSLPFTFLAYSLLSVTLLYDPILSLLHSLFLLHVFSLPHSLSGFSLLMKTAVTHEKC